MFLAHLDNQINILSVNLDEMSLYFFRLLVLYIFGLFSIKVCFNVNLSVVQIYLYCKSLN